ncbi:MAG: Mrp/NBP35 family ATP-binding protein [Oscillospiraceae bacterium]|nr:Mrp/NBP35 family ATP-binding protein [Oscillospiraceae bacterium]
MDTNSEREFQEVPENCTHDCSTCGANCPSKNGGDMHVALNAQSSVKKVIGIVSGKGGVGKSLVCALSAVFMQRRGNRTAILDADVTGPSIPNMFGIHELAMSTGEMILPQRSKMGTDILSANLLLEDASEPIVWRGPMIANLVQQFWSDTYWKDVDYMFVDMPPGTGDVPLTVFQSLPVDGIIIVTSPQELVSMIVGKAVRMAQMMNIPIIGIVENMSYVTCPDCGKQIKVFGDSHIDEIAEKAGIQVLAKLPINPEFARLADTGMIELVEDETASAIADAVEEFCK